MARLTAISGSGGSLTLVLTILMLFMTVLLWHAQSRGHDIIVQMEEMMAEVRRLNRTLEELDFDMNGAAGCLATKKVHEAESTKYKAETPDKDTKLTALGTSGTKLQEDVKKLQTDVMATNVTFIQLAAKFFECDRACNETITNGTANNCFGLSMTTSSSSAKSQKSLLQRLFGADSNS